MAPFSSLTKVIVASFSIFEHIEKVQAESWLIKFDLHLTFKPPVRINYTWYVWCFYVLWISLSSLHLTRDTLKLSCPSIGQKIKIKIKNLQFVTSSHINRSVSNPTYTTHWWNGYFVSRWQFQPFSPPF